MQRAPLKGVNDYGDFTQVGRWLVEAKKRKRLQGEIIGWVNTAITKTRWAAHRFLRESGEMPTVERTRQVALDEFPWVILMAGDKRNQPDIDLAVMPAAVAARMLVAWEDPYFARP